MSERTDPGRLAGALAGRYRIEGPLGEGGGATVWRALDLRHDRPVAIKVLRPELVALVGTQRFLDEIRTTANLRHPHLLPLFDSGEVDGVPFYVMPLVEGESLRERLRRDGPLDVDEALSIARDVGAALAYAHGHGILHRDIKPGNVLLGEGGALLADFGIALALSAGEDDVERLTREGLRVGTPSYMSPEQVADEPIGVPSDVFALGALLHEMLTGAPPFEAPNLRALVSRILTGPTPSVREARPEVPEPVANAVARALEKAPDDRFPSIDAFLAALAPADGAGRPRTGLRLAVAAAIVVALGTAGLLGWRALRRSEARADLVEIGRLVDAGEYMEAYDRAVAAERWIPGDSALRRAFDDVSDVVTIATRPAGASVRLQRYTPDQASPPPQTIGTTPIERLRVPRAEYRMEIELDGYQTVERMLSSELRREGLFAPGEARRLDLDLALTPSSDVPAGMVPVPGGEYELVSPDAPPGLSHELAPFFIDRLEVTRADYAAFVDAGGYGADSLWEGTPADVRARLADRTGLPAPRQWTGQRPPEGGDRLPVVGVSWYEALAFCRSRDARLPTIFEWEKTARAGETANVGVMMPWGWAGSTQMGAARANFNSDGPVAVGSHPFGVSPYGAADIAGNVREWLANPSDGGRTATGGSWRGPSYLYTEYSVEGAGAASSDIGFRCARHAGEGDQGSGPIDLEIPTPTYTPVGRDEFRTLLDFYRYDPVPPRPRGNVAIETPGWTRERWTIDGVDGDSVLVYVWAPASAAPPYQTLVYIASSAAFSGLTVAEEVEWVMGPVIRAGRAVVAPVLQGMVERPFPPGSTVPEPSTVAFRDLMIRHATEMRLAMDYAETRPDIDGDAFVYAAFSFGAGSRLGFAATDDRFRATIFIGGGIDERVKPTLPAADNVNFAPYVAAPVLMVNGLDDEEHPWASRALPLWNLLPEPKTRELVDGGGHLPPAERRIPAINRFLDEVMGAVRRP